MLLLIDPALHELQALLEAVVLLPNSRVSFRYVVHFLDVATLNAVRDAREVLLFGIELLRLGKQPIALQRQQNMSGLAGEHQQTGQAIGNVNVQRTSVISEDPA